MLLLFVIQWNKQFTHVISVQKWLVPVVSSHPLLNLSPCASSLLKRCRDSLCPSFTRTQLLLLPFFFFFPSLSFFPSIFTCNLSCTVQNLGVPSTHTQTHAQLDWQMICSSQMGAGTWMAPWPACRCTQSKSEMEKSRHCCAFPCSGTQCWGAPLCRLVLERLGATWAAQHLSQASMWQSWTQFLSPDAPAGKNCFTVWNLCSLVGLWRGGGGQAWCRFVGLHTSPQPAAAQS